MGRYHDAVVASVRAYEADTALARACLAPYAIEHNADMLIYAANMAGQVRRLPPLLAYHCVALHHDSKLRCVWVDANLKCCTLSPSLSAMLLAGSAWTSEPAQAAQQLMRHRCLRLQPVPVVMRGCMRCQS